MNGKRAKALRRVAAEIAQENLAAPPGSNGVVPQALYVQQTHRTKFGVRRTRRLGPCVRKIEQESKREFNNLCRG